MSAISMSLGASRIVFNHLRPKQADIQGHLRTKTDITNTYADNGCHPEQTMTGSGGYLANAGLVFASPQR